MNTPTNESQSSATSNQTIADLHQMVHRYNRFTVVHAAKKAAKDVAGGMVASAVLGFAAAPAAGATMTAPSVAALVCVGGAATLLYGIYSANQVSNYVEKKIISLRLGRQLSKEVDQRNGQNLVGRWTPNNLGDAKYGRDLGDYVMPREYRRSGRVFGMCVLSTTLAVSVVGSGCYSAAKLAFKAGCLLNNQAKPAAVAPAMVETPSR